ncbi:MAG: serine hydrolase [Gammaproteobacteria bacterium]
MRRMLAILLVLFLAPAVAAPQARNGLEGFDEFVKAAMKEEKVTGMAIVIVQDGKVIHAKGYGLRDINKNLPVTPQTLFAIGSITKSFTCSALGVLADEGKLDWDKPVREYLPDFRLHDGVASERMTPRDLVTHRSGLPRHDLLWYGSTLTRKEMYDRLRYLEPSKDFRNLWHYNNLMFMTAGVLTEKITGGSWEQFVRQRILLPLGMETANFSVHESQKRPDFALPYRKAKEETAEVPFRVLDHIGPAGSINSSVEEMGRYLLMHMNDGKIEKGRILSERAAREMQTPQMVVPAASPHDELGHSSYGHGFVISSYRGHKTVSHGGGIDGFNALLSFLPGKKTGLVILSNTSANPLLAPVTYNAFDRLLGLEEIAWRQRFKDQQKKQREAAAAKKDAPRKTGTTPSHALTEYAGSYEHPGYGVMTVALEKDELQARFNHIKAPLKHYHYDVFEVTPDPLNPEQKSKVTFTLNPRGEVHSLAAQLEPAVKDIVFTRMPEKRLLEKSALEPLAGEYQLGALTATVTLRADNTLLLSVPGQPQYELVPARDLTFDIKGLSGFSVEFRKNAAGAVTELISHQPNGSFTGKKK